MFCSICGEQLQDEMRFCPQCGTSVEAVDIKEATMPVTESAWSNNGTDNSYTPYVQQPTYPQPCIQPQYYSQPQSYVPHMVRCKNCKTLFSGQSVCPTCHSADIDEKPDLWMGIVALCCSIMGGWFGILFGALGLSSAKKTGYKKLKIMCTIAIPLCIVTMIAGAIVSAIVMTELYS